MFIKIFSVLECNQLCQQEDYCKSQCLLIFTLLGNVTTIIGNFFIQVCHALISLENFTGRSILLELFSVTGSEFIKTLWFPWSFSTLWQLLTLSPIFMKVKMKRFNQITKFLHFYINFLITVLTPKNPVVQFKLYDLQPDAGSPHVLFSSKTKLFSFSFSKYF